MSLYEATVPQFKKMLQNVERWLDKAIGYADSKKFDPNTLLSARLAPDQLPLVRQIQSVCDQAKFTVARLTDKEPPKHPDTEQTIDELKARIHDVSAYLDSYSPKDFEGAEERKIAPAVLRGAALRGADYLNEMQLPNFYFHATTAYSILRHNGVDVGKLDFLGTLKLLT